MCVSEVATAARQPRSSSRPGYNHLRYFLRDIVVDGPEILHIGLGGKGIETYHSGPIQAFPRLSFVLNFQ